MLFDDQARHCEYCAPYICVHTQVYLLKVSQVPQSKLHLKLLQATKVIIALVKEKKQLTAQLKEVTAGLDRRKTSPINPITHSKQVQLCDKCVQTVRTRDSPPGQGYSRSLESSTDLKSRVGDHESGSAAHPSWSSKPGATPLTPANGHKPSQDQVHHHEKTSSNNQQQSSREEAQSSSGRMQGEQLPADVSLASLKFTDSSLGESSLNQVLQMVERELSSSDNERDVPVIMRHSTPEPPPLLGAGRGPPQECHRGDGGSLELVESKVVPLVLSKKPRQPQTVVAAQTNRPRTQSRTTKPRVRNYNIRD